MVVVSVPYGAKRDFFLFFFFYREYAPPLMCAVNEAKNAYENHTYIHYSVTLVY